MAQIEPKPPREKRGGFLLEKCRHVYRRGCIVIYMNTTTAATVHYDLTGNAFYSVSSTGFCGADTGEFTIARAEITCVDCMARIS